MKFRRLIFIAAMISAAAISCKKDDDAASMPSLQGTMQIQGLPEFISPRQVCTLKVKGAVHPEGKEMGYYWKVSPSMKQYDTTDVFIHTFSDTLQTYTVYCYAFASGYSSNSTSTYSTVVKGGKNGSLTGDGYNPEASSIAIGSQTWTPANVSSGEGLGFRNADVMADVFGKFYSFDQAQKACEALGADWKLPSLEDWDALEEYIMSQEMSKSTVAPLMLKNAKFNGTEMWEYWPAVGDITNQTGFSAIPAGYANISAGSFSGVYEYAAFWTSTSVDDDDTMAYYKYMICDEPDMFTGKADKASFGASARCIRK